MKIKKAIFLGLLLLLVVSLMLPLGCTKETDTPMPTEYKTFSKYGFSFKYPKGFSVIESGLNGNEANDTSGMVEVSLENDEFKSFYAVWLKRTESTLEIAGHLQLEAFFTGWESAEFIASVDRGEIVETTKAGHQMLYQYYTATSIEGDNMYGIVGVFYCDESRQNFVLVTMNSDISAKQDVLEDFQNYLNSFVCH